MSVVMGTAGHIDHGKTSLVRALTGTDCDRLEEEKKRGITIELGFAFMELPDGGKLSIVDVPGHERFVKNMVAGAAGIDFVTLVIAADEGVMPQTREHLEICSLLGIRNGLVALSKVDMVDGDWLALVLEDIRSFLKGSFLEGAPVYPVSSQTGQGMEELRRALEEMAAWYNPERRGDLPRLPVDRVFTLRGHGTVVTGTLISGSFRLGEDLILMPSGLSSKARGLQSHGQAVEVAEAGYRTAVNLSMLEVGQINRGEVLTRSGALFPSQVWTVELYCLSSSPRALRQRAEIHFHHQAREVQAVMYFPDREKLNPKERCLCQIHFTEPLVGVYGDRFVLRSFAPLRTVAGGILLHPLHLPLRRKAAEFADNMIFLQELRSVSLTAALGSGFGENKGNDANILEKLILLQLRLRGKEGASFAQLCVLVDFDSGRLDKLLRLMGSRQLVFLVDKEERRYVHGAELLKLCDSCLGYFKDFHKKEPLLPGLGRGAVLSGWGRGLAPKLVHFVIERLLKQGDIAVAGDVFHLSGHQLSLGASHEDLRASILGIYREAGDAPPNIKEVLDGFAMDFKDAKALLRLMQSSGELVKVTESIYYEGGVMQAIKDKVIRWFDGHDNLELADLRDLTGLSRKYLVALLEYFDSSKLTVRVGDKRLLRLKS